MATLSELRQEEQSFKDRLAQRRSQFEGAQGQANQVAAQGLSKAGAGVNPLEILNQLSAFRQSGLGSITPLENALADLRSQIFAQEQFDYKKQQDALDRQGSGLSSKDLIELQLKAADSGYQLSQDEQGNLTLIPGQGGPNAKAESLARSILSGVGTLKDVPIEERGPVMERMKALGYDPSAQANKVIDTLEELYFGDKPMKASVLENFLGKLVAGSDIAVGSPLNLPAFVGLQAEKLLKTDRGQRANSYKDLKEGFTATLKQITGDTGVMTDEDMKRLVKILPKETMTIDEAKKRFQQVRDILQSKYNQLGSQNTKQLSDEAEQAINEIIGRRGGGGGAE